MDFQRYLHLLEKEYDIDEIKKKLDVNVSKLQLNSKKYYKKRNCIF